VKTSMASVELLRTAETGDLDQVKKLLASDPALLDQVQDKVSSLQNDTLTSQDGGTALHIAARASHLEVVKSLIAAGATIDQEDNV